MGMQVGAGGDLQGRAGQDTRENGVTVHGQFREVCSCAFCTDNPRQSKDCFDNKLGKGSFGQGAGATCVQWN